MSVLLLIFSVMKRFLHWMVLVVFSGAMVCTVLACVKPGTEDVATRGVKVSGVVSTECLPQEGHFSVKGIETPDTVAVSVSEGVVYVEHRHLSVNCAFERVGVSLLMEGSTVRVTEYGTPDDANCVCEINNSFRIENLPRGVYTIVVENCASGPYSQIVNI